MRSGVGVRRRHRRESSHRQGHGDGDGEAIRRSDRCPGFDEAAREIFATKKNLRLVEVVPLQQKWVLKNVSGGVLLQDNDMRPLTEADLKVVSERKPTEQEMRDMLFAWKVCKHVKSNAILYARNGQSTGVGAGQMSRVDSAKIGAMKSVLGIKGSVAASDAFFPFPDGVEEIAKAGATAIIQPGGSVRDQEVIDAANKLGLAMVTPEYGISGTRKRLPAIKCPPSAKKIKGAPLIRGVRMSGQWRTFSASPSPTASATTYGQEVHGVGQFLPGIGTGRALSPLS